MTWEPRSINEDRQTVAQAKEFKLMCGHCNGVVYVKLEYPYTEELKMQARKAAIEEHRGLCPKAPPGAFRVWSIERPRA